MIQKHEGNKIILPNGIYVSRFQYGIAGTG